MATQKERPMIKHDIEANWIIAGKKGFVPKNGEIIIYDKDKNNSNIKLKVGDGYTNINELPNILETISSEKENFKISGDILVL